MYVDITADTNHFQRPTYALPIFSLLSEPYQKLFSKSIKPIINQITNTINPEIEASGFY